MLRSAGRHRERLPPPRPLPTPAGQGQPLRPRESLLPLPSPQSPGPPHSDAGSRPRQTRHGTARRPSRPHPGGPRGCPRPGHYLAAGWGLRRRGARRPLLAWRCPAQLGRQAAAQVQEAVAQLLILGPQPLQLGAAAPGAARRLPRLQPADLRRQPPQLLLLPRQAQRRHLSGRHLPPATAGGPALLRQAAAAAPPARSAPRYHPGAAGPAPALRGGGGRATGCGGDRGRAGWDSRGLAGELVFVLLLG